LYIEAHFKGNKMTTKERFFDELTYGESYDYASRANMVDVWAYVQTEIIGNYELLLAEKMGNKMTLEEELRLYWGKVVFLADSEEERINLVLPFIKQSLSEKEKIITDLCEENKKAYQQGIADAIEACKDKITCLNSMAVNEIIDHLKKLEN